MEVLKSKGLLAHRCGLNEQIRDQLTGNDVHKADKATLLKNAFMNLTEQNPSVAVYTCTHICNTIAFLNNKFVLVDTRRISTELGGNGNTLIKLVHCEATSEPKKPRGSRIPILARGFQSLLQLVINGRSTCEPGDMTLSDEELLASLTPFLKDYPEEHEISSHKTLCPTDQSTLHPRNKKRRSRNARRDYRSGTGKL